METYLLLWNKEEEPQAPPVWQLPQKRPLGWMGGALCGGTLQGSHLRCLAACNQTEESISLTPLKVLEQQVSG